MYRRQGPYTGIKVKRVNICIDKDLLLWLEKQQNKSAYICSLIYQDIYCHGQRK